MTVVLLVAKVTLVVLAALGLRRLARGSAAAIGGVIVTAAFVLPRFCRSLRPRRRIAIFRRSGRHPRVRQVAHSPARSLIRREVPFPGFF